jgi:hypothetical protein
MTEDELLSGLLDAAFLGGWLVHHIRRSDLALTMGTPGFPDILAVHPKRGVLVIECKSERGRMEPGQSEWLDAFTDAGVKARVVRPEDYDQTWRHLVGDRLIERRRWTDDPDER